MSLPTSPLVQELRPDRLRCLLYGSPGAGKTTFAAGWYPKTNLIIDLEGGTRFLAGDHFIVRPQSYAEFASTINDVCAGGHPYTTVTIDTGSALVDMADADAGARYGKVAAGVVEFGKGMADRDGTIKKDLGRLLKTDLGVILTCHALRAADEDAGTDVFMPALPTGSAGKPGIREFAMGAFDFLWFARKAIDRELVVTPNAKYECKSRVPMPDTLPLDPKAAYDAVAAGIVELRNAATQQPVAA